VITAIAHAAWAPDRKPALDRLLKQTPGALVISSTVREHARVWAPRLWQLAHGAAKPGEWCNFLNDDVTIAPDHAIEAMLEAVPADALGVSLATVLPGARPTYESGGRWLASYLCTGPGYAMRCETVAELLEFHAETLTDGMRAQMNEDEVIAHFAWSKQLPFWQCVPALVAHDVSIKSTLGFDNHPMRVASLLWHEVPREELQRWPIPAGGPTYAPHPWLGEGRMAAVRRAYQNSWDFSDICVFCAKRPILMLSPETGAGLCGQCVADAVGHVMMNARIA